LALIILVVGSLVAWAWACQRLLQNPRGDFTAGMIWHGMRWYSKTVHRLRIEGITNRPQDRHPGPLIIVCNHTAGIDPILVQSACPFEIRFVMAKDMRHPLLEWFWQIANVIFVDRETRDAMGAREAIRHVRSGGVLGIFPEGGLERPPRTILPFQAGVGLIIKRTEAPVLPVVVRDTPVADQAWGSMIVRSRSVVSFQPLIQYSKSDSADGIADDLRARYQHWTGWPLSDEA
jgi:1-acyl-sn-glycerol-3-phosphate acyltransferase